MIRPASPSIYVTGALRGLPALPRRADGSESFRQVFGRRLGAASLDPGVLSTLAQAIQQQEGYYPGSLAWQNNNPGNLVYAGQYGASPGAGGFASFPTYAAGFNALENQINLDAVRGSDLNGNPTTTLNELIASWAPASAGNDTSSYVTNVASQTGFDPSANLFSLGSSDAGSGVDLSSIGISSPVPAGLAIAGAALLALLVFRLF